MIQAFDQVCAADITYFPLQKGFLFMVAIVDLSSRNLPSWKFSTVLSWNSVSMRWKCPVGRDRKPEVFHPTRPPLSFANCSDTAGAYLALKSLNRGTTV